MKKVLLTIGLVSVAALSFGQGEVNFANSTTTRITTNSVMGGASTGSTASSVTALNAYYYALFVAAPNVTAANGSGLAVLGNAGAYAWSDVAWTFTGGTATNLGVGRIGGNNAADGGTFVPGFAPQTSGSFLVIGWSANIGSSLAALMNWYANPDKTGWIGQSPVGVGQLIGGGLASPSTIFNTSGGAIPGWTLGRVDPVPEPTTFTLAGLGAAAMLIFRRRK